MGFRREVGALRMARSAPLASLSQIEQTFCLGTGRLQRRLLERAVSRSDCAAAAVHLLLARGGGAERAVAHRGVPAGGGAGSR